jgi:hypothetical protein
MASHQCDLSTGSFEVTANGVTCAGQPGTGNSWFLYGVSETSSIDISDATIDIELEWVDLTHETPFTVTNSNVFVTLTKDNVLYATNSSAVQCEEYSNMTFDGGDSGFLYATSEDFAPTIGTSGTCHTIKFIACGLGLASDAGSAIGTELSSFNPDGGFCPHCLYELGVWGGNRGGYSVENGTVTIDEIIIVRSEVQFEGGSMEGGARLGTRQSDDTSSQEIGRIVVDASYLILPAPGMSAGIGTGISYEPSKQKIGSILVSGGSIVQGWVDYCSGIGTGSADESSQAVTHSIALAR